MHVGFGVLMFSVAVGGDGGARLRSSAPFVDSIDRCGSEAHSMEVVCYGKASPACFKHLGCCGLEVKSASNFLTSSLSVGAWIRHGIGHFIPFPHLLESYTYQQGVSDDLPVHLGSFLA